MRLLWGSRNMDKIRSHGLEPGDIESAFDAEDWAHVPSDVSFRFVGEGTTTSGRLIRVVFAETADGLYPITAFPIRPRQWRTP